MNLILNVMSVSCLLLGLYADGVDECKEFYSTILGARITFDSDWYAVITFFNNMSVVFMEPDKSTSEIETGNVTLNILVDDVDAEYSKLKDKVNIVCDLANQPWGDRSFRILDPIGNIVYIYMSAAVSDEYKDAIKE